MILLALSILQPLPVGEEGENKKNTTITDLVFMLEYIAEFKTPGDKTESIRVLSTVLTSTLQAGLIDSIQLRYGSACLTHSQKGFRVQYVRAPDKCPQSADFLKSQKPLV